LITFLALTDVKNYLLLRYVSFSVIMFDFLFLIISRFTTREKQRALNNPYSFPMYIFLVCTTLYYSVLLFYQLSK
jgi:hypothetical protein